MQSVLFTANLAQYHSIVLSNCSFYNISSILAQLSKPTCWCVVKVGLKKLTDCLAPICADLVNVAISAQLIFHDDYMTLYDQGDNPWFLASVLTNAPHHSRPHLFITHSPQLCLTLLHLTCAPHHCPTPLHLTHASRTCPSSLHLTPAPRTCPSPLPHTTAPYTC